MASVDKQELPGQALKVTVTLTPEDYMPVFQKELKAYRKTAHLKGFRKGTVPLNLIKKIAGHKLFEKAISDQLNDALEEALSETPIVGNRLKPDPDVVVDIQGYDKPATYTFVYWALREPKIEWREFDHVFTRYTVSDDLLQLAEKELEKFRESFSSVTETTDERDETTVFELVRADEKAAEYDFNFFLRITDVENTELKEKLLKTPVGEKVPIRLEHLSEAAAKIFSEKLTADDTVPDSVTFEIQKVFSIKPAELNQEFFDKIFGPGQVTTKEEALEKISLGLKAQYSSMSDQILMKEWKDFLLQQLYVEVDDAILKLLYADKIEATDSVTFRHIKDEISWKAIRLAWKEKYQVETPSNNEVLHYLARDLGSQFGLPPDHELVVKYARSLIKSRAKEYYSVFFAIFDSSVFESAKADLKTREVPVTVEELIRKRDTAYADPVDMDAG